jgi:hypothetical protein
MKEAVNYLFHQDETVQGKVGWLIGANFPGWM